MSYVCSVCYTLYPCTVAAHNEVWSLRVWQPEGTQSSIPCWVLDHSECSVPMFCKCTCHDKRLDEPTSSSPFPQSLAEQ